MKSSTHPTDETPVRQTLEDREQLVALSEIAQRGYKLRAELATVTAEWESVRASLIRKPSIDIGAVAVYW